MSKQKHIQKNILLLLMILLIRGYSFALLPIFNDISVNNDTIGIYQKFEITVDLTANYINPFNFDQVNLQGHFTSPTGNQINVDGFYYQDYLFNPPDGALILNGSPIWKIRFSPNETGTWTYEVVCSDDTGTTYSATYTFVCTTSPDPGFVRNTAGKFQAFDNGEPFFAIGMNIPWNIFSNGFYVYDEWIDSLAANNANYIKIIMAPWSFEIEWNNTGLGNYTNRLDIAFWLDHVLEKATEEDIYMQLCPLIHDAVSTQSDNHWANSPYNAANGGPCPNTWDFYSNSTALYYYKRRLRYINARWGFSSHLSAWELFTEADNSGDYNNHRTEINNWLIETGQYLSSTDDNDHLISVSYAFFEHDADMWNHSIIDFTQIHRYETSSDLELSLYAATKQYLIDFPKPTIIGEFGLSHYPLEAVTLDPNGIAFHNSLWATSFSGSFGAAATWHWDQYIDSMNLYYHFAPVSSFMHSTNLLDESYSPVSVLCSSDDYLDTTIEPKFFDLFTPAPENYFTVERSGIITPRANNLSIMLYGYWYNSSRNPPHFYVDYAETGQFSLVTGDFALFSHIKIWIDGVNVLSLSGHANTTYTVNVPQGNHMIFVENTGNFYIEVDKYIFGNYAPVCRSFALQDSTSLVGWVQNRRYNWEYINANGYPPVLSGGQMQFEDLFESYYEVEWWNCSTSMLDSGSIHIADSGNLFLDVPPLLWDAAYRINYLDWQLTPEFAASQTQICTGDTIQFTDLTSGVITNWLWQFPGGIPSTSSQQHPLVIYNNQGIYNAILTVVNDFDTATITKTNYISVDTVPGLPGYITGAPQVCRGDNNITYSVSPVAGATSYQWTVPPGASGSGSSNSILISYGQQASSGFVTVKAVNDCGTGPVSSKYITVMPLVEEAGLITGNELVCQGAQDITYSVTPIPNATNYIWTLPEGALGNSTTNTITVSFEETASSGQISVAGSNYCGDGPTSFLNIVVDPLPSIAGPIWGDTTVCQGDQNVYYYVDPIPEATDYIWTLPYGASGSSNTNEIFVTFDSPLVCGFLTAAGNNNCGQGNASWLQVCVDPLPVVLEQPTDTIIYEFGTAVIRILSLPDLNYQWQLSTDNGISWLNLEDTAYYYGSNDHQLYIIGADLFMNGNQYRCIVSGVCEPQAVSNYATLTVIPPGWDITETSVVHNIFIPLISHPTINDEPIPPYDYIGVFFENGDSLVCGGAQQWNGSTTTIISAFGDDPQTSGKDGFNPGEGFHWKIYSRSRGSSYDATASFLFGPDAFTANGISTLASLKAFAYINHVINIPEGWSGISSYVLPTNDTIEYIFDSIVDNLMIVMDMINMYWPEQGINDLGYWDPFSGYKIKVETPCHITIKGLDEAGKTIMLQYGWNLIPVLSSKPLSTIQTGVFSDLGDTLTIVKEIAGTDVYWPDEEIMTLTHVVPGAAYILHVSDHCFLTFPDPGPSPDMISLVPYSNHDVPWNEITKTQNSHIISITKGALSSVKVNDIIGGFTPQNICAGYTTLNDVSGNHSLALFGHDPTEVTINGFLEEEEIHLQVYRPSTCETFEVAALFDTNLPDQGFFKTNGLSKINALYLEPLDISTPKLHVVIEVYPNPFSNLLTVYIPDIDENEAVINIYNIDGQLIRNEIINSRLSEIQLASFAKGIYFILIDYKSQRLYKKILKK
ncbi:MAG: DUF5060 domain-containing protein [Bacteroidales bacterium]|nr:DUF5060 domain-containing protein [Bacteroidales bacterium]